MNRTIFKAYDIRGRYPDELNEGAVAEIARALAKKFGSGKVVIGHDARVSSKPLYAAVLSGIMNKESGIMDLEKPSIIRNSCFVIHALGPCTTPMFYFLANKLKAVGGVMVTASHAPKEFNGLKVVGPKAEVISGVEIKKWII